MNPVHCYTSFTFSYLSRALILCRTLKAAHPDWIFWALMVDEPPPGEDFSNSLSEFDHITYAKDLGIADFDAWLFKHDIVEACTAVKGRMLQYLFEQGAQKAIYLDPDIAVFHPLIDIVDKLDTHSIILTPHQVAPNDDDGAVRDNEITSLQYGVFNLGFVAVRNDKNGQAYADWWARSLYMACYDDTANGIFTDQKWCDLVPALFEGVYVERDPGCNVASWNLSKRTVELISDGSITVNGSPLKFYHFTKINSAGDIMTDKYLRNGLGALEVWNWYKRTLSEISLPAIPKGYWHYGNFENGVPISKMARILFRHRSDLRAHFRNPFGYQFFDWLAAEEPDIIGANQAKRSFAV